ncbi:MAG: hypothetical protein QXI58_05335 [Candidatus Micrarchaeia archaeon]
MLVCERFTKLLPTIRKEVAILMYKRGMKESDIAKSLKITKSAISQYIRRKRGKKSSSVKKYLSDYDFKKSFEENICKVLCKKIRKDFCLSCESENCAICSVNLCK